MRRSALTQQHRSRPRSPESFAWAQAAKVSRCAVCNRQAHHGHHIVYAAHLRREHLDALMYDLRNQLPICASDHARHHSGFARIPRDVLPPAALAFALEIGMDWLIDREYAWT